MLHHETEASPGRVQIALRTRGFVELQPNDRELAIAGQAAIPGTRLTLLVDLPWDPTVLSHVLENGVGSAHGHLLVPWLVEEAPRFQEATNRVSNGVSEGCDSRLERAAPKVATRVLGERPIEVSSGCRLEGWVRSDVVTFEDRPGHACVVRVGVSKVGISSPGSIFIETGR